MGTVDHIRILNDIRDPQTLACALDYAIHDRVKNDHFYDPIEIDHTLRHQDQVLDEIAQELTSPDDYQPRPAFAYYPPKSALCYRRMVYVPIKDLVVRYALGIVFADRLDPQMIPTCFANRRSSGEQRSVSFTEPFQSRGWPAFCAWQREQAETAKVLIRCDISSFYDSISHRHLLMTLAGELGVNE